MPNTFTSQDDTQTDADPRPHHMLSSMINQGRSFSGRERNCCFLNLGSNVSRQFADVSASSGLDFPDDGRGVAVTDWDADGDLDLWISNRNAPRLRFMRNNESDNNNSLTLRLVGNGNDTNRDAIGARVELYVRDAAGVTKRIQTLRAGHGFLSQSSKWLHFGLGTSVSVEKVDVKWPCRKEANARIETFQGLDINRRYVLTQGTGTPVEAPRVGRCLPCPPRSPRSRHRLKPLALSP